MDRCKEICHASNMYLKHLKYLFIKEVFVSLEFFKIFMVKLEKTLCMIWCLGQTQTLSKKKPQWLTIAILVSQFVEMKRH